MIEEYKNKESFTLPENYFEDFVARMEARIEADARAERPYKQEENNGSTKGRRIDFRRWATLVASSAAVFVGLIFGGFALMNIQQQVDAQAAEIIAQETYEDELLEMLDIYRIELALADAEYPE